MVEQGRSSTQAAQTACLTKEMPSGSTHDSSALSLLCPFWVISEDPSLGSRTLELIAFSYTNGTQEAISICSLGRCQSWDPSTQGRVEPSNLQQREFSIVNLNLLLQWAGCFWCYWSRRFRTRALVPLTS